MEYVDLNKVLPRWLAENPLTLTHKGMCFVSDVTEITDKLYTEISRLRQQNADMAAWINAQQEGV